MACRARTDHPDYRGGRCGPSGTSPARRAGGQLITNGRIPIQAIIASIEADQATATAED